MENLLVTVGSITTATRLEKLLRKNKGVASRVIHTPAQISGGGCSYSIITNRSNMIYVRETAHENSIKIRGYYIETVNRGEKQYHVIS